VIALSIAIFPNVASAVEAPLTLGTASTYGVLANTTITSATASSITGSAGGDIGLSGGSSITGSITYPGTPIIGAVAGVAMTSASTALGDTRVGTATVVELGNGRTITPGAYTNGTLEINGALTLDGQGNANAVFIFRSSATLITGAASSVVLTGGAQACNVYWQIGSSATLGATSTIVGHVIASTSITTGLGSIVNGQLIATTGAVTLGGTTITNPACAVVTPVVTTVAAPVVVAEPTVADAIETGTVNVIKVVANRYGGTKVAADFIIRIEKLGVEVPESPLIGLGFPGKPVVLPVGTYLFSEVDALGYRGAWTGDITYGGKVIVTKGSHLTVTRTNYDDVSYVATSPTPVATPSDTPAATPSPEPTTEAGGVLPNTSTPFGNWALIGAALLITGGLGFAARKSLAK